MWEIYNRKDGLVYVICDGYREFLREPAVAGDLQRAVLSLVRR